MRSIERDAGPPGATRLLGPDPDAVVDPSIGRPPRLLFVGPMVGRTPGFVTTQGEVLSDNFARAGYEVLSVSNRPRRLARFVDIVVTILRERRWTDIVMLQTYGGLSFVVEDVASLLSRRLGHRIVMVLRGGAMPEFMARHPRWSRRVLARADAIITPSAFLAQGIRPHGFSASVIPNVIALERYPYRRRSSVRPRFFWMRTFHPVWNPEMAVRVLALLRKDFPEATLTMAGDDTQGLRRGVEQLADSLRLGDAVRFVGFLDMEGKAREGQEADIFLNTNRIDNMPVAVVEACAMGLPVVSTNVGGVPYLLRDGETALLVPSEDDAAMAAAVKRLLNEPGLAQRLSENGRRLAEESSWSRVLPLWESQFRDLMSRTRPR